MAETKSEILRAIPTILNSARDSQDVSANNNFGGGIGWVMWNGTAHEASCHSLQYHNIPHQTNCMEG